MELIDLDAKFNEVLSDWIEKNRARYKRPEDMEEDVPDVYLRFLNAPAEWLGGRTPAEMFDDRNDAGELCGLMKRYIMEGVPLPDPLPDRLIAIGDEEALLALVRDKAAPCEARMTAIDLLRQLDSTLPMVDYIRWQVERDDEEEILDSALESLRMMGERVKAPAKIAFLASGTEGKEALLDVLCEYPGDEDVFTFALDSFKRTADKRALYAGYLAKLDDDRALEALLDAAESDDVSYIDFIEIRSAIERLGSEAPVRDFSDDPTYKAVRRLQTK